MQSISTYLNGRSRRAVADKIFSTHDFKSKRSLIDDYIFDQLSPYDTSDENKAAIETKTKALGFEHMSVTDSLLVNERCTVMCEHLPKLIKQKYRMSRNWGDAQERQAAKVAHDVDFHRDDHDFLAGVKNFVNLHGGDDPIRASYALKQVETWLCFERPSMWNTLRGGDRASREPWIEVKDVVVTCLVRIYPDAKAFGSASRKMFHKVVT